MQSHTVTHSNTCIIKHSSITLEDLLCTFARTGYISYSFSILVPGIHTILIADVRSSSRTSIALLKTPSISSEFLSPAVSVLFICFVPLPGWLPRKHPMLTIIAIHLHVYSGLSSEQHTAVSILGPH
jgi:hypothetical protein